MALGLGHCLTANIIYVPDFMAMDFDGTNDYGLGGISGQDPANGTIKPISPSGLTIAAWVKLDIDSDSYDDTGTYSIAGANRNGGYMLNYANKSFSFVMKLKDGDGNTVNTSPISKRQVMRTPTSGTDYASYLYKSDNWHFVVGTWDGDRVKQIYVDGDRSQAGTAAEDGSSGVTQFGSEPESSDSKKTESAASPAGTYVIGWDSTNDREEVDFVVGATSSFDSGTNITTASGAFFPGQMGDIAVWDVELSQVEIKALYGLHRPIDMSTTQASNLQGYWKAEHGTTTTVTEKTGKVGDDLTLINGVDHSSIVIPTLDVTGYAGYR